MHVVLYGGAFNPPTLAHVGVVTALLASGHSSSSFDELLIVPTYEHAYGKALAPYSDRLEMCRLAFQAFFQPASVTSYRSPYDDGIVSISQLDKVILSEPRGSMYSTCEQLISMMPGLDVSIVIGQDQAEEIGTRWYSGLKLFDLVGVIVIPRANKPVDFAKYPWLSRCTILYDLPAEMRNVSSTKAREALQVNADVDNLLQPQVAEFCIRKGLYND